MEDCVFCRIVNGDEPADIIDEWGPCMAIVPLNPVVPGHILVIPRRHVADFTEDPYLTAEVIHITSLYARDIGPCNLITSKGKEATQSVFHMHLHIVPRKEDDELWLPWSEQIR